jgi:hypothetical protein
MLQALDKFPIGDRMITALLKTKLLHWFVPTTLVKR